MPRLPLASHNVLPQTPSIGAVPRQRGPKRGLAGTHVLQYPNTGAKPMAWQFQLGPITDGTPAAIAQPAVPQPQATNIRRAPGLPGMANASRASVVPALSDLVLRTDQQRRRVGPDGTPSPITLERGPIRPSQVPRMTLRDMQKRSLGGGSLTPPDRTAEFLTLRNLQSANAQMQAGHPVTGQVSPETEAIASQAWAEGQRPQGPFDQAGWENASAQLQSRLASEGRAILDSRAAGNEELRRQMFARTGNRSPNTVMRGRYWMGPVATEEAVAPTGMNLDQQRELLETIRYRDQERASARDRILAGGGLPTAPRSGLGGLIDRLLPPQRYDISTDPRPGFAEQAARIEEAKAKRQRYLAGVGEYEGRGPADRAAAIAAKRAPVVANAMADRQERNWRMSGGPQQLAFDNALAAQAVARSPIAGAEMFRARAAAQEAALNREIQREELQIRRDMMRGDFDERRMARLDAMKMQQAQLGFEREQRAAQIGLGRDSLAAQLEQGRQQHAESMQQGTERMEQIRAQGRTAANEQTMQRQMLQSQRRDQLRTQYPEASEEQIEAQLNREFGGAPTSGAAGAPGMDMAGEPGIPAGGTAAGGAPALPLWAQGKTPQEVVRIGTAIGWPDGALNALVQQISGNPTANVEYPTGVGFLNRYLGLKQVGNFLGNLFSPGAPYGGREMLRPDYIRPSRRGVRMTRETADWARRAAG